MTTIYVNYNDVMADSRTTHYRNGKVVGYTDGTIKLVSRDGIVYSQAGDADYWKKFVDFINGERILPPIIANSRSFLLISTVGSARVYTFKRINFFVRPQVYNFKPTGWICFGSGSDYICDAVDKSNGDYQQMFSIVADNDPSTNNDIHCLSPTATKSIPLWRLIVGNFKRFLTRDKDTQYDNIS